jgi:UDP-glucose 4-epimerase
VNFENARGPMETSCWESKRVLVTGASGFLGGHIVSALERCAEVSAISRSERSGKHVRWYKVDLTDREAVKHVFKETRPQWVLHLSSLANGARDISLVEKIFDAEVVSTLNILLASDNSCIERILLPGSFEESDGNEAPSSPYAAAKASSRLYAQMFHLLYDLPLVMTRIFMCYGPRQPEWKLIPYAISCLRRGEAPRVASPDRPVDWIYAPDAVRGLLAAASAQHLAGSSVDIGSGHLHTIGEVVNILRTIVNPSVQLNFSAAAPRAHEQVKRADAITTEKLIGWRAQTPLHEGLRLTADIVGQK